MKYLWILICVFVSAPAYADWKEIATKEALREKAIKEAMFPNGDRSFWASVRDDGTDRSGYAEYLCLILHEAGMPAGHSTTITIWNLSVERKLGRFSCRKQGKLDKPAVSKPAKKQENSSILFKLFN